MKTVSRIAAISAVALGVAGGASAQTALTGVSALDDRIDTITETATNDLDQANDAARFANTTVPQGWRGSLAFSTSTTNGSTDTGDISLAGRMTYGAGQWNHLVGIAGEYGRSGSTVTKKEVFATYEANRYFSGDLYAFGLGRVQYDGLAATELDSFLGFGPGYRVINNENTTWRVQAGPGIRYIRDNANNTTTDWSGLASSRLWFRINDNWSLTNDTDVVYSQTSTAATNDLGLNVRMSDNLSTRFSVRTDYDSSAATKVENTVGASLVIGF